MNLKLPTAIVGLGLTGRAVEKLLRALKVPQDQILLFDAKDPGATFQDPAELLKKNPKSLIISPGVPLALPWIQDFKNAGGQITSELTLATQYLTTEKVIGVTGSIGKSTCASLLHAGLSRFSPSSFVGGNLGFPLADYVTAKLSGRAVAEWVVLELSSYQLENYENLKCAGALFTYFTSNHMERYPSLEKYYETKCFLIERTEGPVVLNKNGGDLFSFCSSRKGNLIWTSGQDPELTNVALPKAKLVGAHNQDNLALVARLARELSWPEEALQGFLDFAGLPHRLENLGLKKGVQFINDSKSTTIESVLQALESTKNLSSQTTHILLGGKDKNLPWNNLSRVSRAQRKFYFFGEVGTKAQAESGLTGEVFPKLAPAIEATLKSVKPGDLVLLSPGGTSLDEFRSFEERGNFFKDQISKY